MKKPRLSPRRLADLFTKLFEEFESHKRDPTADFNTLFALFNAEFRASRHQRIALTPHLNVLNIFGLTAAELRHSRVLAWFLNPEAEHEQGALFVRVLLRLLTENQGANSTTFVSLADTEDYIVECERHKRTDVSAWCPRRFAIFVENKVHHVERDEQISDTIAELVRFADAEAIPLQNRFAVFLTDDRRPPETAPVGVVPGFQRQNLIAMSRLDLFLAFDTALKNEAISSPLLENLLSCYVNSSRQLRNL